MGISKLVKTIRKNTIKVKIFPQNGQYAFALLNINQNNKEILRSHPQYNSKGKAEEEGNALIEEIRSENFKEITSNVPPKYL